MGGQEESLAIGLWPRLFGFPLHDDTAESTQRPADFSVRAHVSGKKTLKVELVTHGIFQSKNHVCMYNFEWIT